MTIDDRIKGIMGRGVDEYNWDIMDLIEIIRELNRRLYRLEECHADKLSQNTESV